MLAEVNAHELAEALLAQVSIDRWLFGMFVAVAIYNVFAHLRMNRLRREIDALKSRNG